MFYSGIPLLHFACCEDRFEAFWETKLQRKKASVVNMCLEKNNLWLKKAEMCFTMKLDRKKYIHLTDESKFGYD